jgi:1,2-phenylacetyl-CoA epoxidase catalytic subunit
VADFIAAMLTVDTALTAQYAALVESRYAPAHNRVQKMLDEERFHYEYAAGWVRRMAAVPELKEELAASLGALPPEALRWLGDDGGAAVRRLLDERLASADPSALRDRVLARIGPLLAEAGLAHGWGWRSPPASGATCTRSTSAAGTRPPAASGCAGRGDRRRARGDLNRSLLLE